MKLEFAYAGIKEKFLLVTVDQSKMDILARENTFVKGKSLDKNMVLNCAFLNDRVPSFKVPRVLVQEL